MMTPKNERLIETDEGILGWCNVEKTYRPIADFQKNLRSSTGYDFRCRACNVRRTQSPEYTADERKEAVRILDILGYETDPNYSKSVYQQFLDKHKL